MRGTFTPQAAERLLVSGFGFYATLRGRPWWAITEPAKEVRPWASDLAEVLNTACEYIPIEWVKAGAVAGSGGAVALGLGLLVLPRIRTDALAAEHARQAAAAPPAGRMPEPAPAAPPRHGPAPNPDPAPRTAPAPRHSGGAAPAPATIAGLFNENGMAA